MIYFGTPMAATRTWARSGCNGCYLFVRVGVNCVVVFCFVFFFFLGGGGVCAFTHSCAVNPASVGEYFASMKGEIAGFFSSDLLRASQTAEIIAEPHGMAVERDPRLREMHLGVFQTNVKAEAEAKFPAEWAAYGASRTFKIPGGESKVELYNRVSAGVEEIAAKFAGKTIIMVAHGGALRTVQARLQGFPVSAQRSRCTHCSLPISDQHTAFAPDPNQTLCVQLVDAAISRVDLGRSRCSTDRCVWSHNPSVPVSPSLPSRPSIPSLPFSRSNTTLPPSVLHTLPACCRPNVLGIVCALDPWVLCSFGTG